MKDIDYEKYITCPSEIWGTFPAGEIPGTLSTTLDLQHAVLDARRILDVGCGNSHLPSAMIRSPMSCWLGVDVNVNAVSCATARNIPGTTFLVHDFLLPWQGPTDFDLVIVNAVLTCLPTWEQRLAVLRNSAKAASREGSTIYVADFLQTWTEPSHASRYKAGISLGLESGTFPVIGPAGEILYLAHHFQEDEFSELAQEAGLHIKFFRVAPGVTRSGNYILTFSAFLR